MGKPTGFLEYDRELPEERSAEERIKDWNEFKLPFSDKVSQIQGARCMECGIPFCHTGELINAMVSGCPLNNLIPEWNDLIYRGLWQEAVKRLLQTNNFPEFTGRVCPAPCEGSCTLGLNEFPVTIKANEYQIIEKAFRKGWIKAEPPSERTGKKVAIVGSGPSGLACADQLNRSGHFVTVYERADRPGGLLMYGIPNMKLAKKEVVQRRTNIMSDEGINFIVNTEVGVDISAEELLGKYDAIVLCAGATVPRDLAVEGRHLNGIHFAVDYLKETTKSLLDSDRRSGEDRSAQGKDVVIIGGGDTGTDCVAASVRQGCKSVVQFEIMPQPPEERQIDNPWPEWPKTLKTDYGQEEAIFIFDRDPREYSTMTQRFIGDKAGNVKQVQTIKVKWGEDIDGNPVPVKIAGTEKVWPAEFILLSMGFTGVEDTLIKAFDLETEIFSGDKIEYDKFRTNIDNVFVAGDMRRGQSLVAWAIKEGRSAAEIVNEYLISMYTGI